MDDNMDAMMADGLLRTVRDAAKLLYGENQTYPCDDVKRMMDDVGRLRADKLPSMSKRILDQDAEIEMYRKTLRDIVRQCNNSGYGSPTVMERMIDRIEDMAIDVLGDAPKKSRTKAEGWEGL